MAFSSVPGGNAIGGDLVEIAPGVHCPGFEAPTLIGVSRFLEAGSGVYRSCLEVLPVYVKLTAAREFGVALEVEPLLRLAVAKFIKASWMLPDVPFICLLSLKCHFDACVDPLFWDHNKRKRYAQAVVPAIKR